MAEFTHLFKYLQTKVCHYKSYEKILLKLKKPFYKVGKKSVLTALDILYNVYILIIWGLISKKVGVMNNCPHCGATIKENYKLCSACGTILINLSTETTAHINLLRKKIESDPKDVNLRVELGSLYQKNGLLYEALDEYKIAIGIDPNNFDAHSKSALIYLKLNDLSNAESSFRSALNIKPDSEESLIGLFRVFYLQNKTIEAITIGEKVIKIKPESVEFHMLMKNLYKQNGDKEKTFLELQKLEQLVPDNEQVIKEIVQYFTDQNDMEGLAKYYQKMEEMNIEDTKLGMAIGKYYYENGNYEKATEMLNKLLTKEGVTDEMRTMILTYLTFASFAKNNLTEAENFVLKIQEPFDRIDEQSRKKLALIFSKIGTNRINNNKKREAISFFERAIKCDPDNKQYQEILSKIRTEILTAQRNFIKKALLIAGSAVAVCIIVILLWNFTRNRIIINIEPTTDLTILIDGRQMELINRKIGVYETPELFIGSHIIDIEKEGYEKWQAKVNLGFGKNTVISASLVPIYGVFQINSQPESADVYLDGMLVGKTPYISENIQAIPHKLELRMPGYQIFTSDIKLVSGETLDLGIIILKNLVGDWKGKIGHDGISYNASFKMTVNQKDGQIKIKYFHQPKNEMTYSGEINGVISKNDFLADGNVNCKERNVFYWTTTKKRVILKGKISDDWERIEGKHYAEGLGEKDWWAVREEQ
ncbi:MAG: PEGA domain-containing protein [candidate division WOR-3 bacterium]